ncbi:MAG: hypothetical protein DHS20C11_01680 [Lysobacteraceae bacterium]|nr:MAG: hypothetical protein DHS20C11_01680 [Xanthomonadaceae bacterium]
MPTRAFIFLLICLLPLACTDSGTSTGAANDREAEPLNIEGSWRGVLRSPGGELPFGVEVSRQEDGYSAVIVNGDERVETSGVGVIGRRVVINFEWYDAEISARVAADGQSMTGHWRKTAAEEEDSTLPFTASRTQSFRFTPATERVFPAKDIGGRWAVTFTDDESSELAVGEFQQQGDRVLGTFLTPTGDYRYLEGDFVGSRLRLSTFDGAHAFLFTAELQADGSLLGDFYSRDTYHATWVGNRDPDASLPDAWTQVELSNQLGQFRFSFENIDGQLMTDQDPTLQGKARLIVLFGTWCPNCNDEAPVLVDWYDRYRAQGLEIVGLAFEYSGDIERDRQMLKRYRERHGIEFPLLLAGTSDKLDAAEVLPDIDKVLAYPTTIFVGRDGQVQGIHSGFAGPGTGEHYVELVTELEARIQAML